MKSTKELKEALQRLHTNNPGNPVWHVYLATECNNDVNDLLEVIEGYDILKRDYDFICKEYDKLFKEKYGLNKKKK